MRKWTHSNATTCPAGLVILNPTDEDAEGRLRDNLEGLYWLLQQTPAQPTGSKPKPRTWHE